MPMPVTTSRSTARGKTISICRVWLDDSGLTITVRIIRAHDCKTTPWRNGGGSTTEIAIGPAGGSLETFDWRISMARVASDGPFSDFDGIDRTLAVIKGSGLVLTIGQGAPVTLSSGADAVSFSGDTPTSARLTAGEITGLNVMTRRGRFIHRLQHLDKSRSCDFVDDDLAIVLSLGGTTEVTAGQDRATLDHGDAALVSRTTTTGFRILPATNCCYLIWLREQRYAAFA
jgi:environmental stress-induced protein Ves